MFFADAFLQHFGWLILIEDYWMCFYFISLFLLLESSMQWNSNDEMLRLKCLRFNFNCLREIHFEAWIFYICHQNWKISLELKNDVLLSQLKVTWKSKKEGRFKKNMRWLLSANHSPSKPTVRSIFCEYENWVPFLQRNHWVLSPNWKSY